ncbi:MAG: anacyclamide/piricyclamide family prenylated cyclic peptide [Solirubrobacteraceae bacterium]
MSENLIESVAPQLAAPVTREPVSRASEADGGTDVALPMVLAVPCFADDDAE